ncbi:MAG: hypothetical protein JO237_04455 [Pseudolabrys sp.]|nr:hypothetical protein [Pseudolabrys sp.]
MDGHPILDTKGQVFSTLVEARKEALMMLRAFHARGAKNIKTVRITDDAGKAVAVVTED